MKYLISKSKEHGLFDGMELKRNGTSWLPKSPDSKKLEKTIRTWIKRYAPYQIFFTLMVRKYNLHALCTKEELIYAKKRGAIRPKGIEAAVNLMEALSKIEQK